MRLLGLIDIVSAAVPRFNYTWPPQVLAPYCDVLLWPPYDLTAAFAATNVNHYTLGFITADTRGFASWGGSRPISSNWFGDQIQSIRSNGGEVIISFGGAAGTELAVANSNVQTITYHYQSVIDQYGTMRLDFDVEGSAAQDTRSVDRRNRAIAALQRKNPGLVVSYTLAATPGGLDSGGLAILRSAKRNYANIDVVNVMAMDYGPEVAPNPVRHMGYYAVLAAQRTLAQLRAAGFPNAKIGITAMIGVNDVPEEIFTISDATRVVNFAIQTAYIGLLSFWSINRDVNDIYAPLYMSSQIVQTPFDFAKAFYRLEYQHTSAL